MRRKVYSIDVGKKESWFSEDGETIILRKQKALEQEVATKNIRFDFDMIYKKQVPPENNCETSIFCDLSLDKKINFPSKGINVISKVGETHDIDNNLVYSNLQLHSLVPFHLNVHQFQETDIQPFRTNCVADRRILNTDYRFESISCNVVYKNTLGQTLTYNKMCYVLDGTLLRSKHCTPKTMSRISIYKFPLNNIQEEISVNVLDSTRDEHTKVFSSCSANVLQKSDVIMIQKNSNISIELQKGEFFEIRMQEYGTVSNLPEGVVYELYSIKGTIQKSGQYSIDIVYGDGSTQVINITIPFYRRLL